MLAHFSFPILSHFIPHHNGRLYEQLFPNFPLGATSDGIHFTLSLTLIALAIS